MTGNLTKNSIQKNSRTNTQKGLKREHNTRLAK